MSYHIATYIVDIQNIETLFGSVSVGSEFGPWEFFEHQSFAKDFYLGTITQTEDFHKYWYTLERLISMNGQFLGPSDWRPLDAGSIPFTQDPIFELFGLKTNPILPVSGDFPLVYILRKQNFEKSKELFQKWTEQGWTMNRRNSKFNRETLQVEYWEEETTFKCTEGQNRVYNRWVKQALISDQDLVFFYY